MKFATGEGHRPERHQPESEVDELGEDVVLQEHGDVDLNNYIREKSNKLLRNRYVNSEGVHSAVQAVLNENSLSRALEIATSECQDMVNADQAKLWLFDSTSKKSHSVSI